jgi:hypothetical protein
MGSEYSRKRQLFRKCLFEERATFQKFGIVWVTHDDSVFLLNLKFFYRIQIFIRPELVTPSTKTFCDQKVFIFS